jgi:hypothetical protein
MTTQTPRKSPDAVPTPKFLAALLRDLFEKARQTAAPGGSRLADAGGRSCPHTLDDKTVIRPAKFAHYVLRVRNLEESIACD